MTVVDIAHAANELPSLIAALEDGATHEFVITRGGQPVARLVPVAPTRIGIAKGAFEVPESTGTDDAEAAKLFRPD
jgi:antitoxin (DNA-binding transcriptional repressor) of toxin-antitoxin stability system